MHKNMAEGEFFKVEKVLKKRITASGSIEYLLKWQGYPPSANTWEPPNNITPDLIEEFHKREHKNKLDKLSTVLTVDTSSRGGNGDVSPLSSASISSSTTKSRTSKNLIQLSPPIKLPAKRRHASPATSSVKPNLLNSSQTCSSSSTFEMDSPRKETGLVSTATSNGMSRASRRKRRPEEDTQSTSSLVSDSSPKEPAMRPNRGKNNSTTTVKSNVSNGYSEVEGKTGSLSALISNQSSGQNDGPVIQEEGIEYHYDNEEEDYAMDVATESQLSEAKKIYHGLIIKSINGVTRLGHKGLFFHVVWQNDPQDDLVPSKFANIFWPQEVIKFYEKHMQLVVLKNS